MHRFHPGQEVYVRPVRFQFASKTVTTLHDHENSFKITESLIFKGCPHYRLVSPTGEEWIVSQLELMSRPFYYDQSFNVQKNLVRLRSAVPMIWHLRAKLVIKL